MAVDLSDGSEGRGAASAMFEETNGKNRYIGYTDCHNYEDLHKLERSDICEAYNALNPQRNIKKGCDKDMDMTQDNKDKRQDDQDM